MSSKNHPNASFALVLGGLFLGLLILVPIIGTALLGSSAHNFQTSIIKAFAVGVPTAFGFALGWLFSPQAKGARNIFMLVIGALLVVVATIFNGPLGWSAISTIAIVGFVMALSYWAGTALRGWSNPPNTFGSSRWATMEDVEDQKLLNENGIRFGKVNGKDEFEWVSYNGDRHLLTVAPTRSGKGTTQIIPNLLTYEGSMLVIDPKGENAMITAKQRVKMGHEVHIVDPWGIVDLDLVTDKTEADDVLVVRSADDTAAFNPLDWLQDGDPDITENAMILADALILPNTNGDAFWTCRGFVPPQVLV